MATRKTSSTKDDGKESGSDASGGGAKRRGAGAIARDAVAELAQLTGREIEGVVGVERGEDDGWIVEIDVVELRRTPTSTDVLATYEVAMDDEGELVGYRRTRRFGRGQVSGEAR